MENTIEKFVALFPEKEKVMRSIWERRNIDENTTKVIGKTPTGQDIWFTNDPEKMLLCGATIPSSYSPVSPSFIYLPTLVLQPYIGMIYVVDKDKLQMYLPTEKGDIEAPKYYCRAFVMHKNCEILAKFPTYGGIDGWCEDLDAFERDEYTAIKSDTPPVEIHLDCMDQYATKDGHVAVFGKYITPQEQIDVYKKRIEK